MARRRLHAVLPALCHFCCLLACSTARQPLRRFLKEAAPLAGPAYLLQDEAPGAAALMGEHVMKLWQEKLVRRLAELGRGVDLTHVVLIGDDETRALFVSFCALVDATSDDLAPSSQPVLCSNEALRLTLTYAATACGRLMPPGLALLRAIGAEQQKREQGQQGQDGQPHPRTRTLVLAGVGSGQYLHLGAALPLRCPAAAADLAGSLEGLLGQATEALGGAAEALVVLGPAALCPERLPPALAAAVAAAQAADRAAADRLVQQCVAAAATVTTAAEQEHAGAQGNHGNTDAAEPALGEGAAAVVEAAAALRSKTAAAATAAAKAAAAAPPSALTALCRETLLTASAVEELNAQAAGAVRLIRDRWGEEEAPGEGGNSGGVGGGGGGVGFLAGYVDVHRATKGHCGLAAAATAALPAARGGGGGGGAAQQFPALAAPVLLEALSRAQAVLR